MRQDCNEVQTELLKWIWKFKSELCFRKANCQFLRRNVYPFHVFFTYDLPTPDYKSNLKYLHLNFNYFFCVATQDRSIEPGQRSPQLEECINAVWSCKQANVFALIMMAAQVIFISRLNVGFSMTSLHKVKRHLIQVPFLSLSIKILKRKLLKRRKIWWSLFK